MASFFWFGVFAASCSTLFFNPDFFKLFTLKLDFLAFHTQPPFPLSSNYYPIKHQSTDFPTPVLPFLILLTLTYSTSTFQRLQGNSHVLWALMLKTSQPWQPSCHSACKRARQAKKELQWSVVSGHARGMNPLAPGGARCVLGGVELGVNESMCGFQSGCSTRLREGALESCGNGSYKKGKASSTTRMVKNTLFHISGFISPFSKEESTMEGQRAELEMMKPKKKSLIPGRSPESNWDNKNFFSIFRLTMC